MRNLCCLSILAVATLAVSGCRADRASQRSSSMDSSIDNQPNLPSRNLPADTAAPTPSPQDAAPLPAAPALANDHRPVIVCFGDSLTAGYGTEAGQSYPDYLQADLDKLGYRYRVVNLGISGNTTKDGVERLNTVLALHPAAVIVEFGGNDGLRGLRIEDSRENLDHILSVLKSGRTGGAPNNVNAAPGNIKVVLAGITLPPDYGPDYIQQFTSTYTLLAKKYHVPVLPFLLQNVFGVPGMMQRDRTHATAAGNKIVATNVLPLVTPLLQK